MIHQRYRAFMRLFLLVCGLLSGLMPPCDSNAVEPAVRPLTERLITIGCELNYPPYETIDENGNADGFSIDLIKAVAAEMDLKLRFVIGPWIALKTSLEQGQIDALPTVAYSQERDLLLDFSTPYIISHAVIFTRKNAGSLGSHESLRGKELIVMRGDSTHEYAVSSQMSDRLILTDSFEEAFTLLASGHHDAVIAPELVGLLLLEKLHIDNIRHIQGHLDAYGRGYAFAVHQGDSELLANLNRGLDLVKASGEYSRIYDKWFGSTIPREGRYAGLMQNALLGLASLALLLLVITVWNSQLRNKVREKTSDLQRSELRFTRFIERAPVPMCHIDQAGCISYFNKRFATTFGYSLEDIPTLNAWWQLACPDETYRSRVLATWDEAVRRASEAGTDIESVDYNITCKSGEVRIIEISGTTVGDSLLASFYDRTAAKQIEDRLRAGEKRFSTIFSQAGIGLALTGLDGRWLKVNATLCNTLGYSSDELMQLTFQDITHPDDLDADLHLLHRTLAGSISTYTIEKRYFRKDGQMLWANLSVSLVRDESGEPEYFVSSIEDISERVRTSERLVHDEKILRALFQSVSDYALVLEIQDDGPPLIADANHAALVKHGYTRDELIGQPITLIDKHSSIDSMNTILAKILQGGTVRFEVMHSCKNGSTFYADVAAQLIQGEGTAKFFAIERDITERKQAQARIEILSQAIMQSGEAMTITDAGARIGFVNPAFTELTGYSEEEVLGKLPSILKSGNQNQAFYKAMWESLIRGEVWQGKVVNRKKSGEFYPAMLTISPVKNSDGDITNYIGLQQDLQSYEELEAQFHQAQKMAAIGTLVGGIAHNFNNDLAGITGNIYLAKRRLKADPDTIGKLEQAEKIAFSAAETIQQLLTFSRKGMVQMHSLSIAAFLKEAAKLHRASLPENIALQLDVKDKDMRINGDINQLQQMLMNLVTNAFDAMQSTEHPSIRIVLRRFMASEAFATRHELAASGAYAHIMVSDNGCGIPPDHMQHIFEPFYTTKEIGRGTGLGLAMVYGAVRMHGGAVDIESSAQGTSVHIFLPVVLSVESGMPIHLHGEVAQGSGETILLVDDNEMVLQTGRELLEDIGYRVLTADDGLSAIEVYRAHPHDIDLLILDVVMPRMGGVDALQAIREINPQARAIFASGYDKLRSQADDIHDTLISKPFSVGKLSRAIRQTLSGEAGDID